MSKDKSLQVAPLGWLAFLCLALSIASLLGITACGGGSSSPGRGGTGGGGGGGGSTTSPPCTFTAPSPGGSTTSVGTTAAIKNQFFGMHLNTPEPTVPWPFFTVNGTPEPLPFGSQRLWAAGVAWAQVNPSQGVYDWTLMETWLSEAQQNNVDILYNLARTPAWASSQPNDSTCSTGAGQCDPPLDLNLDGSGTDDYWIAWVTAVAQFSHTQKTSGLTGISYYEIWNEWNTGAYWSQNSSYASIAQLVRMEQDARCVVEGPPSGASCNANSAFPNGTALDPGAQIVSPSPVGGDVNNLLDEVQISLNNYFSTQVPPATGYFGGAFSDAIGFHGYVGTATGVSTTPVACPTAENVNTVIADLNQALTSHPAVAAGKPLFDTEAGWSKAPDEGFTDPDQQAAFLARYMLLQESSNIARVYWFAWDSKSDGSLYNDTTEQIVPAATAYGEVNQWTVGATITNACSATGTVWQCGFTRPGGYSALAVWDASLDCTASSCPTTTAFAVPAGGYIEYRDVAGNVTALGTATSVQIGAKPILLESQKLP